MSTFSEGGSPIDNSLRAVDLGFWHCDLPSRRLTWDTKVKEQFGLTPDSEVTLEQFYSLVQEEDRLATKLAIENSIADGTGFDIRYRTLEIEGTSRWIRAIGRVSSVRLEGITLDITKTGELQEAELPEKEQTDRQFRTLADSIPQLAWMADETGWIFWYNSRWYEYTGKTPQEMEGWGWESVHDPIELPKVLGRWQASIANGEPFDMVFPLRGTDGTFRPFLTRIVPLRGANGQVLRWFGTNTDITEQRRAEDALRQSRERLQAALEASATGTFHWDIRTGEIEWDESLDMLFGVTDQARVHNLENFLALIHPEDRAGVVAACERSAGAGADFEMEFRAVQSGGETHWVRARGKTLIDPDGVPSKMTGACTDITSRRQAEELLSERARLSALGADIGVATTEDAPLRKTLQQCAEAIVHHLDAAFARVWTLSENGKFLELQASAGVYTHIDGGHARVPVGAFKIGQIASERLPHLTNDVLHDERVADREWARRERMTSFAGYPLVVDDRLVGVVALFARKPLGETTLTALASIVDSIALGIERKQNELARLAGEARKTAILETALDCFVTIDAEGCILEFNAAAENTFGYKREEVIGRKMKDLIMPPEYRPSHEAGLHRYLNHGIASILGKRLEVRGMRADGSEFPLELAVNRIPGEGPVLFTATLRNITEAHKARKDLQEAKDAAEAASRAKSDFLATMSHELRTPLNAIIGYGEMLQEEAEDLGADTLVPDLKKIHSAGKHLLSLINDILDLSKIEAGKMELFLETFSISGMIDDAAGFVRALVQQNNNTLELRVAPNLGEMRADLTKVRQSLFNLLANAAKFTSNGSVVIEAHVDTSDTSRIVFCVQDTGIGLSADQISRLFQPFQQSDHSVSRKYGGTGLGLALTQRFCHMMEGNVTVRSELGSGSSFTIRLPRQVNPISQFVVGLNKGLDTHTVADEGKGTVLIIDDDPDACDLIERVVTKEGFRAVIAHNGEEGLRKAAELKPALITLDVMMPRMDGWTVLSALKKTHDLQHIPVIMLTMMDDRNLGYSLGASDYLTKPVERDRLASVLRKYSCELPPCSALIIDDDADARRLLRLMLEREGWTVAEAGEGRQGLEQVSRHQPSLILLDLMMPLMDGFEFSLELRRNPAWQKIPVLVLTSKDLNDEDRSRLNGRVERVLMKNAYTRDELLREVRHAVQNCHV